MSFGCYSEKEFLEIMAGLEQNTTDSLIEEHVNKIREGIVQKKWLFCRKHPDTPYNPLYWTHIVARGWDLKGNWLELDHNHQDIPYDWTCHRSCIKKIIINSIKGINTAKNPWTCPWLPLESNSSKWKQWVAPIGHQCNEEDSFQTCVLMFLHETQQKSKGRAAIKHSSHCK